MMRTKLCFLGIFSVIVIGCSDLIVNEPISNDNVADFEVAWQITKQHYPFFTFKRINWDSIYTVYRPLAEQSQGDEIYPVLHEMMSELKDGHIEIHTQGGFPVITPI